MIFKEIEFENFRNFHGVQRLTFSIDPQKPVTVILANNGFGKTTILNAIYWCLFGESLGDFKIEKALNTQAMTENKNTLSVKLVFEDSGVEYEACRVATFSFAAGGQTSIKLKPFKMIKFSSGGNADPIPENLAQLIINKVLPKQMAKLFIFEGEGRAKEFLSPTNSEAIAKDIKRVIGAEEISQLVSDLNDVVTQSEKAIRENNKNGEIASYATTISGFEKREKDHLEKLDEWDKELSRLKETIETENRIIHGNPDAEAIENRRKKLADEVILIKNRISNIKLRKSKWVREKAITIISQTAANESQDIIDEKDLKGKLPGDYQQDFINRILKNGECICGTKFTKGSPEYKKLADCIGEGDNSVQIQAALQVKAAIFSFQNNYNASVEELKNIEDDELRFEQQLTDSQIDLENTERQLENVPVEKIKEANQRRKRAYDRVEELNRWIGDKRRLLNELLKEKKELQKTLESLEKRAPEIQKVKDENKEAKEIIDYAIKWLDSHESLARRDLTQKINQTLAALGQGFEAYFDEKFNLSIKQKATGVEIQKNTGTGQLLALSFVSSLIRFCESRASDPNSILTAGTVAPLVLDAPFGVLDEGVRKIVAQLLPQMAQQSIILVSDSQASVLHSERFRKFVGVSHAIIHEVEAMSEQDKERQFFSFPERQIEVTRVGDSERYYLETVKL